MTQHEMITFKDQSPAYEYEVPSNPDPTYDIAQNNDADLQNFFSRPIRIWTAQWGTGTTLDHTINPWDLFFTNKRVMNRISNFNLLRCKLRVKVLINGNGFHYGRAMMSYLPLHHEDEFTLDRGLIIQDLIGASQRPKIFLDPTTSQGGDFLLPFFWHKNALNIPLKQWEQMGILRLRSIQALRHANDAQDKVTISVFAWAEDVQLSMPTSAEPGGLTPQMGKVMGGGDEYQKDGLISKTASAVAEAAGALKDVPVIGPYMRSTEMVANATAGVAKSYGYCKPVDLTDTARMKPHPTGDLAVSDGADICRKLSVDSKQELTIDSRVVGLDGTDEMTISSIATRESFLTRFQWSTGNEPDQRIFETEVTPMLWDFVPGSGNNVDEIHMTACGFAAAPFLHWHGTMKYRFQIVASNFHKGRLKVVYDPYGFQSDEFNTNYTHIIDIAEEKDFTVEIGWGTHEGFCIVGAPGRYYKGSNISPRDRPFEVGANSGPSAVPGERCNGILRVYVVNSLTTPNSDVSIPIEINVFACAGDDMQFRNPSDTISRYSHFANFGDTKRSTKIEPQMGLVDDSPVTQGDMEATDEPSKPLQEQTEVAMATMPSGMDHYSMVFHGEVIDSFRTLLKRYCHSAMVAVLGAEEGANVYWWTVKARIFPYYAGWAPGAIYPVTLPRPGSYNYGELTLLNYLTPAYTGRRGGIRWKALFTNPGNFPTPTTIRVDRIEDNVEWANSIIIAGKETMNGFLFSAQRDKISGITGTAIAHTDVNPCLEWESPYQRRDRFLPAKQADMTSFHEEGDGFKLTTLIKTTGDSSHHYDLFCAAAEDFSLYFFTGAPVMYYETTIPL